MTEFFFDVWAADDLTGTALGELDQAYARTWTRLDQAIGSGQFTINRHDSQWTDGWCAQDNLVRVRLVGGGPFAYDDERYVFAFFIESGDDEAVSVDEEAGEEITRGGRDAVVILRRAVVNFEADYAGDDGYFAKTLIDGNTHFLNRNAGNVLRLLLRNATARTPNPLAPSTHDFNTSHDTNGTTWSDDDADWHIPVGLDMLEVLGTLASGDVYWRMGTDLVLHAYDDDPSSDVSGSVAFTHGDNIRESAQRRVNAREAVSRVLVQGTKKAGGLTYRWVSSSSTETLLGGRREGFVEYQATPTATRLDKAGRRAIRSRLKQHDGPTTLGVEERAGDPIAFDDYQPGDSVTVDIPGVWESVVSKVYGIQMDEDDAGDALVTVILEAQPFDPSSGATSDAGLDDTTGPSGGGSGSGTGGGGCGGCPPPPPHEPGDTPDVYPDCGPVSWPYSGSIGGLSDTNNCGDLANADPIGWICFLSGETYHYEITLHSADGGAGPWSWGLSSTKCSFAGEQVENAGSVANGADVTLTGTFVAASHDDAVRVYFWTTVADSLHLNRAITATFRFWPDGSPTPGTPNPPLTGQMVLGESPDVSIGSSDTTLTLDWPYAAGSLRIRVDGILISPASYVQTTPTSGVVTLSWALDGDEVVTVDYQAAT